MDPSPSSRGEARRLFTLLRTVFLAIAVFLIAAFAWWAYFRMPSALHG